MTVRQYLNSLKKPNDVGSSEYRALYELVSDIVASAPLGQPDEPTLALIKTSLGEVKRMANWMIRDMEAECKSQKRRTRK